MTTVLVVDDDSDIRETLDEYLTGRGVDVLLAADGVEMKNALANDAVDLVLMDLNLPGENGIELTRYLSREHNVGVIIVTAIGDPEDRVLGLESGADDYVVKPFNLRELLARINSVVRRHDPKPGATAASSFSGWQLSSDGGLVREDGHRVELSTGEIDLLRVLLENIDKPVTREELLLRSSHRDLEPFDRSVDVRIARLRQKMEVDSAHPQIIRTVRNIGYVLVSG